MARNHPMARDRRSVLTIDEYEACAMKLGIMHLVPRIAVPREFLCDDRPRLLRNDEESDTESGNDRHVSAVRDGRRR